MWVEHRTKPGVFVVVVVVVGKKSKAGQTKKRGGQQVKAKLTGV